MTSTSAIKRTLAENWKRVTERVAHACNLARRDPDSVKIVAVTKYAPLDVVRALVEMGVRDLGENRVQEFTRRAAMVKEWLSRRTLAGGEALAPPRWHMIGHLQRNKVKPLLPFADVIQSVDSLRLAEEIDAQAAKLERVIPVLMEINATGESTKTGVAVAAATHLAEQVATLKNLELRGLMAMGPQTKNREQVRNTFIRVRELFDEMIGERIGGSRFRELSIGMSNDFELGIEFGATYVRIGSALFEGIELETPVETE